jgi:polysaccharide biosynthesis protein PelA
MTAYIALVMMGVGMLTWWFLQKKTYQWVIYYGDQFQSLNLKKTKLAILEPENINVDDFNMPAGEGPIFIGYLSVGEAAEHQPFWYLAREGKYLVEENKNWKGAWRVDIRDPEWQALLLEEAIPRIIKKGYKGLFLDTIDTASYLESKDPERFAGSKNSLINFIRKVNKKFPDLLIIPNGGIEYLEQYHNVIYGVAIEDLHTRYDFNSKRSTKTPMEATVAKEKILDAFLLSTDKPVFNILYESSSNSDLARYAINRSKKKGYYWYLTTVDLMTPPSF